MLFTSILAARIPELYIEPDVRTMMEGDHPEFVYNDWLEEYFGIKDPAVLIVIDDGPDGVFTSETLALVQQLSEAMEELEGIDGEDLVSLSAVDNITGEDDVLEVEPFFEEPPATPQEALAIREAVFGNRMMLGALVSRDGRATMIIGELEDGSDKVEIYLRLQQIVDATPLGAARVLIAGRPVIEGEMGRLAAEDLAQMFPLVILAAALLLFLSLRSLRGVVLPLLVVVNSVVWALGLIVWTNSTFFAITTIMPVLLVAIGVANGIHIIHHFLLGVAEHPERPAREIVFETMQQLTPPVVMTSLTTAGGIGSLAVSSMRPIQGFGLFTAAGVLAGMVFSLTLLPAILCLLPLPLRAARRTARTQTEKGGFVTLLLDTLTPLVIRHPLLAMGVASVLILVAVAGIPRVVVDSSLLRNFPAANPVKLADDAITDYFGGSQPMQITLDAGAEDAWKVPENLRALDRLQSHMLAADHTSETRSIVDYIKRMNEVMNPEDPGANRVPDSQDLVAQYLLLYSMSGDPDDFEDVIDRPLPDSEPAGPADFGPLAADPTGHRRCRGLRRRAAGAARHRDPHLGHRTDHLGVHGLDHHRTDPQPRTGAPDRASPGRADEPVVHGRPLHAAARGGGHPAQLRSDGLVPRAARRDDSPAELDGNRHRSRLRHPFRVPLSAMSARWTYPRGDDAGDPEHLRRRHLLQRGGRARRLPGAGHLRVSSEPLPRRARLDQHGGVLPRNGDPARRGAAPRPASLRPPR